jgi:hypothetical protein
LRNPGIDPSARTNAARGSPVDPPGIWARHRTADIRTPKIDWKPAERLSADAGHLNDVTVRVDRDHGDDHGVGKIDVLNCGIGVEEDVAAPGKPPVQGEA